MNPSAHISTDLVRLGYSESSLPTRTYNLHCHNFYEVYFFLDGDVDYLVEGQAYKPTPNSLLLLSPHVFHGVRINDTRTYKRFSIHFHPDILSVDRRSFLLSVFPSFEREPVQRIYFEQVDRYGIPSCLDALEDCAFPDHDVTEMMLSVSVEALLSRIMVMSRACQGTSAGHPVSNTVTDVIRYLNRNLEKNVTLDFLSEHFFISKHYLNKVFRKATGTTVMDYLLHKRIAIARQLLTAGCSAQEAALRTGFSDYSSFYRAYRKVQGHSPVQDRGILPSFLAEEASGNGDLALDLPSFLQGDGDS